MKNIDWNVLGLVVLRVVKFLVVLALCVTAVLLAFVYLGPWMLLAFPAYIIYLYIKFEYDEEMLRRGKK